MAPPGLAGRPGPGLPWDQPQASHGDPEETGRGCGSPGGPVPGSLPHPHRGHPWDLSLDSHTGRPAAGEQHSPAHGVETRLPGEEAERLAFRNFAAPTPVPPRSQPLPTKGSSATPTCHRSSHCRSPCTGPKDRPSQGQGSVGQCPAPGEGHAPWPPGSPEPGRPDGLHAQQQLFQKAGHLTQVTKLRPTRNFHHKWPVNMLALLTAPAAKSSPTHICHEKGGCYILGGSSPRPTASMCPNSTDCCSLPPWESPGS